MAKKVADVTKGTPKQEIQFMQNLYGDFKKTFGEVFKDSKDTWSKHKVLIMLAFLAFLLFRNRTYTIDGFVKKLQDTILGKREQW